MGLRQGILGAQAPAGVDCYYVNGDEAMMTPDERLLLIRLTDAVVTLAKLLPAEGIYTIHNGPPIKAGHVQELEELTARVDSDWLKRIQQKQG